MSVLMLFLTLPACFEYAFNKNKDESHPGEDTWDVDTGDEIVDSGEPAEACDTPTFDPVEVGITDVCVPDGDGSFTPIVEWGLGEGGNSRATVVVGDVNQDGMPDIVANIARFGSDGSFFGTGALVVAAGDGSGTLWEDAEADMGFAAHPALGDIDGDGGPEIVVIKEYATSLVGAVGDYTMVAYDADGAILWESEHFIGDDFEYASSVTLADMDHDGQVEIVAGRVILRPDGSTRGVGLYGRGTYGSVDLGGWTPDESGLTAVVDLDLDGQDEIVVGNAMYNADGDAIWHDASADDAYVAPLNLDADPEGEFIAVTGNTVRAVDTDGTVIWGPQMIPSANIVSPPAVDDLDGDGMPEVVVAGGNKLVTLNAEDGSTLWTARVTDETGASGASIFDFEGDGVPEVVYIDEVEMAAYDGATGALKFYSDEHSSDTMFDYPTIADVDEDGQAEIVMGQAVKRAGWSIYGDLDESWAPARQVWNQHAYSITNINDDLSIPSTATPNFTTFNSWHSALDENTSMGQIVDLEPEILDVCVDDCDDGVLRVAGRVLNRSEREIPAGVAVSLYLDIGGSTALAATVETTAAIPSGLSGETLQFEVSASLSRGATGVWLSVDDDGEGVGSITECTEANNAVVWRGPLVSGHNLRIESRQRSPR